MSDPLVTAEEFVKGKMPERRRRGMVPSLKSRPRYSKTSQAPYYNESFGKGLLPVLIQMIETHKDKEITKLPSVSIGTMYQRVQQAFSYCVDKLDANGLLEKLRKEVCIRKTQRGVVICFVENVEKYASQARSYNVSPRNGDFPVRDAISIEWREELNSFIEDLPRPELNLTDGFALSPMEVTEIRTILSLMPPDLEIEVVRLDQFTIHLRRKASV